MDLKLIALLDSHPRMTYTDLAASLGVSRPTARAMVHRLANERALRTACMVDYRSLGYRRSVTFCIDTAPGCLSDVANRLAALADIKFVTSCAGPFRIICWGFFRDLTDVWDVIADGVDKIPGISRCEAVMCHEIKPHRPLDTHRQGGGTAGHAPAFDDLDLALMAELRSNGRETVSALAERLGSSRSTIERKIKRLLDGGVVRFVTLARPPHGGYRGLAWLGMRVSPSRIKDAGEALVSHERVRSVHLCSGPYDVMAWVLFTDHGDLIEFLAGEVGPIPGVVGIETCTSLRILKA